MTAEHKHIINQMFAYNDSSSWDELSQIFTDDVIYCRPGQPMLRGITSLISFFKNDRPVAFGVHKIYKIFSINENQSAVLGWFNGELKNGSSFQVGFFDYIVFSGNKICIRKTYLDNQSQDHVGEDLLELIN